MRVAAILSIVLLMVVYIPVVAQDSGGVVPGERIRVSRGGEVHSGTLVSLDDRDITILSPEQSEERTFSRDDISLMERYSGTGSRWKMGALIGGGAGLVFGLIRAAQTDRSDEEFARFLGADNIDTVGTIVVTAAGAAAGGLIGLLIKTERWDEVPITQNADLGFMPARKGGYLTLSLSF